MTKKDKKIMKDALTTIKVLIDNPNFIKRVEEAGYRVDIEAIMKTFTDAARWKSKTPLVTKKKV